MEDIHQVALTKNDFQNQIKSQVFAVCGFSGLSGFQCEERNSKSLHKSF